MLLIRAQTQTKVDQGKDGVTAIMNNEAREREARAIFFR